MSHASYGYTTAAEWRHAAIQRPNGIDETTSGQRRSQADAHNKLENITDSDALNDQQLYILGKMDMEEYQAYLLFKHSKSG